MGSRKSRHLFPTLFAALLLSGTLAALAEASKWQVARGPSEVGFAVSHLVFSEVEGRFTRFSGKVELPGDDFEQARILADIEASPDDALQAWLASYVQG